MPENFDAFGEVLPARDINTADTSGTYPVTLSRVGQAIFWALVVVIVLARIFYFTNPVFQPGDTHATKTEIAR